MLKYIPHPSKFMKPLCKNCKFYINKNLSPSLNECKKFGTTSSNKNIKYEYADVARAQIDLCGHIGLYFEEDVLKILK